MKSTPSIKLIVLALVAIFASTKVVHYHFHNVPYNFLDQGMPVSVKSHRAEIIPEHKIIYNDVDQKKKCPPKCGSEIVPVCHQECKLICTKGKKGTCVNSCKDVCENIKQYVCRPVYVEIDQECPIQ